MEDSGDTERDAPRRALSSLHDQANLVFQVYAKAAGQSLPEDDPVSAITEVAAFAVVQLREEAGLGRTVNPFALTCRHIFAGNEDGADGKSGKEVQDLR
jgi:hypothetical protein